MALASGLVGCSPGAAAPATDPNQSKADCSAVREQAEPSLLAANDWQRGAFASARRQGVAVVRYQGQGCDAQLELVPNCVAPGNYEFMPYWEADSRHARNATELFTEIPLFAASLAGKFENNHVLRADYMLAGIAQIPVGTRYQVSDLIGDCSRATHVVTRMYLGGFALASGESTLLEASTSVFVKAGTRAEHVTEEVRRAGDPTACDESRQSQRENANCSAPLRLTLQPLTQARSCFDQGECTARCDRGDMSSCIDLAWMSLLGKGVPRDPARGAQLFKQACDGGNPLGCADLGLLYLYGKDIAQDYGRAWDLLSAACDRGVAFSCTRVGTIFAQGLAAPPDRAKAAAYFGRGCAGGDADGCPLAAAGFKEGCDGGDAAACVELTRILASGASGVPKDAARAAAAMDQGCKLGSATCCVELGGFYLDGFGVPKDSARALELFHGSCGASQVDGCGALGMLYLNGGQGFAKDPARALAFFDQGCDGGSSQACTYLGGLYEDGESVPQNLPKAIELFTGSCDHGEADACAELGSLYEEGKGVKLDPARAATLYRQACSMGFDDACHALQRLSANH